jgi:cardiolipin synthase
MSFKSQIITGSYTAKNKVKLIRAGEEYFNTLLRLICEARDNIHIQTYIYDDDETGKQVANALKEAVKKGVSVYLMADGYASQVMSAAFINELRNSGIHFRFFNPFFRGRYFYFGRRMHHKIAVIDTKWALVGGVNIADRYNDMPGKPAWLDFALLAEGEIAKDLCIHCWKTWNGFPANMGIIPCEETQINFDFSPENCSQVRMCRNDWVRRKNEITATYVSMLRNANKNVTILCSYFLPGNVIRKQIVYAIKRGVSIRVIAAGRSDVVLAKYAERWLYDWLLRNGIELYEYQKNILHAKIATSDDEWMTIGSYNINNISTYASIELNLDVRDPGFAKNVRQMLEEIIKKDCVQITPLYQLKTKNIFKQFIRWYSFQFIRVLFYVFTFYFKHLR